MTESSVYAPELRAAPPRRLLALGVLYALGGIALLLAAGGSAGAGAALALLAIGALVLTLAESLRRATQLALLLGEAGLEDSEGRVLARWEEIARVERGTFAFKPSSGFALRLHQRAGFAWAPGLWWRMGRRLGVGGVTDGRAARAMAEAIAARLEQR
ncbi:hypothetical protein ACXN5S_17400 [Pseudoroseicyclus sp. H15]